MKHQHRAIRSQSKDRGWSHCVTPARCAAHAARQDAHGNIVRVDVCACGATRETEINLQSRNYGEWREAAK